MELLQLPQIAPLRFHLETTGPFRVPEYKGGLFRGGFGQFFRDLVCQTRAPVCTGCPHLETCPYAVVFETPVNSTFSVLRKYPNAPHPFTMTPPLDSRTQLGAGAAMTLDVTLIGRGISYLPHFIVVFEKMGASGKYGGRFRVKGVSSAVCGSPIYDGATKRVFETPGAWQAQPEPAPVRRIRLEFLTPLRMRTEGRYNASPDFGEIARALLRRLHLLAAIYGFGDGDGEGLRPLLAQTDAVVTEQAQFRMFQWGRTSGREGRRVQMDGVVGSVTASGELTGLAPYLRAGEWLHVGSGTSMGMGRYRMTVGGSE